jgi:alcohol dehydrogenase (NADP+)
MLTARGYAAQTARSPLRPFSFSRRDVGPEDVLIRIEYCGICHSDLHQARDEWGGAIFPMVPGHEIVGTAMQVGRDVELIRQGQRVGVGCFVDSCRTCEQCRKGLEQYCDGPLVFTYNGLEKDGKTPTYGGYSDQLVVDQHYVLRIPEGIALERAAPLLCAGITTYSPLRQWGVGKGDRLGVVGLGGLGHMAVKIGAALGAEVTIFSRSAGKEKDAARLGAARFQVASDKAAMADLAGKFDAIIDTVSASHQYDLYLKLLKTDGTLILVGAPEHPLSIHAMPLLSKRRRLVGSNIGGIQETQELLEFCAEHNCPADVEVIPIQQVNEAYERMLRGDVRYRFVIDMSSLR